jgi:hypothetical protein
MQADPWKCIEIHQPRVSDAVDWRPRSRVRFGTNTYHLNEGLGLLITRLHKARINCVSNHTPPQLVMLLHV